MINIYQINIKLLIKTYIVSSTLLNQSIFELDIVGESNLTDGAT